MHIYQVLITTQFGCRVTAYGLEIITGACLVEGIGGEVEDTVIGLVLQQLLFIRQYLECFVAVFAGYKHTVVAETLVHRPHIGDNQTAQYQAHIEVEVLLFGFVVTAIGIAEDHQSTKYHKQQRTPCITLDKGGTLVKDSIVYLLSHLPFPLRIVGRSNIYTAACQCHYKAYQTRNTPRHKDAVAQTFPRKRAVSNGFECHKA